MSGLEDVRGNRAETERAGRSFPPGTVVRHQSANPATPGEGTAIVAGKPYRLGGVLRVVVIPAGGQIADSTDVPVSELEYLASGIEALMFDKRQAVAQLDKQDWKATVTKAVEDLLTENPDAAAEYDQLLNAVGAPPRRRRLTATLHLDVEFEFDALFPNDPQSPEAVVRQPKLVENSFTVRADEEGICVEHDADLGNVTLSGVPVVTISNMEVTQ